jgi:methyl-accepting chemotaxis protein WspA
MEMDKFFAEVRQGAADVQSISMQLANIIARVQQVSPRFEEVNVAMGHQAEHARSINAAIVILGAEMQQTTAAFKESFTALAHLNDAAHDLQTGVSQFKVK